MTPSAIHERYRFDADVVLGGGILAAELEAFARANHGPGLLLIGSSGHLAASPSIAHLRSQFALEVLDVSDVSDFQTLGAAARSLPPDVAWQVTVGGARVIDVSKLLSVRRPDGVAVAAAANDHDEFDARMREIHWALPSLAAPTVLGGSAETSPLADVLRDQHGSKRPIVHRSLIPDVVVVDSAIVTHAPQEITAASLVDAIVHVIDPWLNTLPAKSLQETTSIHVLTELVRLAQAQTRRRLTDYEILNLARLSHIGLRPGIARPSAHASVIHRLEHAIPPDLFRSHGDGLAWVAVRFLRWLERERHDVAARFARSVSSSFACRNLASVLFEELFSSMKMPIQAELSSSNATLTVDRALNSFQVTRFLPGNLKIGRAEAEQILGESVGRSAKHSSPMARHRPDSLRMFGRELPSDHRPVVITPVAPLFAGLAERATLTASGWFQTADIQLGGTDVLCLLGTPGGSALRNLVDLVQSTCQSTGTWYFLGLAAALTSTHQLGSALEVRDCLIDDRRTKVRSATSRATGCITSVDHLADETPEKLDYLRFLGADLLDLESATFVSWCSRQGRDARVLVGVSDTPTAPIWTLDATTARRTIDLCTVAMIKLLEKHVVARSTCP